MKAWAEKKERGSSWTMRFMYWLCRHKFQGIISLLLYPIVMYFFITAGDTRQASRTFFLRAKGSFTWRDHYKQLMCFARALVDRVFILSRQSSHIKIHSHGLEQLLDVQQRGQGAILLGSHLGSFEAGEGFVQGDINLDIHIVAFHGNSQKVRSVLDETNPEMVKRIIDPSQPDAVFKMREVIEAGGMLAVLADRAGFGDKTVEVNFMGELAEFPAGPYLIASILKCPVFCFFSMRDNHNIYESHIIKLADIIDLPRKAKQEKLTEYVQQYANIFASFTKEYPYNWFNFFDFWSK
ncbi:MAG: hypothetical protein R8L53_08425 [Mariprofundales bacterium]